MLEAEEARLLRDSIDLAAPTGLRDRALIALMVYSFARISAALAMKREDVFVQGRRLWVRLHALSRRPRQLGDTPLTLADAFAMIRRRAQAAGIATKIGDHTFRATGITTYLKNGGTLENAAAMAKHASTRTTQLYDRRRDDIALAEVERVRL